MTVVKDFALPDLGEGLTESELVNWHVAVGDEVRLNQIIAEVETAKALVELPSPWSGVVSALYVEPGVTVSVGERMIAFEVEGEPDAPPVPSVPAAAADLPEPNLVGYGAPAESGDRPHRRPRPGLAVAVEPVAVSASVSTAERPRATPPVRRLARERGVDLRALVGSGDRGVITRHDVEAVVTAGTATETATGTATGAAAAAAPVRERRFPIKGVRRLTAEAMVRSAFTAPHATVFLTVDVTPTSELLDRLRARREFADNRPGLLAIVAKALCLAIRRTPSVNARWEEATQEIVEFGYVNLGIAAATPRGLVVPTIPDAESLNLGELATAIRELAETARAGRTAPERLSGGTISITNVGVFGVDAGTPILTPGEAAILALGAVRRQPWEHRGEIALREVVTLALSFDHRVVDGEQAARFLADIGRILADPATTLAMV
ncbi:dihydrolipoamide acetyltransferase family protein [Leifsonia poae]|uniref:dihydrolipoamide acetyltransferase family protein n=1 Tax=Leifsonia poae TaxID=110933 RepID=UPI001CBADEC7|nr:dihydrolipoamide acetyltransferase family protein [Leifsonia poae]